MRMRNLILLVLALGIAVLIRFRAEQLSEFSDAVYWQILPWVLIIFFWVVIVRNVLRARTAASSTR
jgi:hypothetical protein